MGLLFLPPDRLDRRAHARLSMYQTQLAWILHLTHECWWFIDTVPEETFAVMSNVYCNTLESVAHHIHYSAATRRVMCQVSDVFRQLKFAFHIPSGHTWVSYFQPPELISWALGHICHMTLNRNISPLCTVQQRVRCKSDSNDSLGSLGNQVLRDQ